MNPGRDCGRFWGEGKIFCFRNANRKILNVYGIHFVCRGQFFCTLIKGGSRVKKRVIVGDFLKCFWKLHVVSNIV